MLLSRSAQPVLRPDRPWENGAALFAVACLPEPHGHDLLVYYLARRRSGNEGNALCLARSADGLSWTKPDLGDGTNIVMRGAGLAMNWGEFMPASIVHEPAATDPSQHWKMAYWDRPNAGSPPGICLATSADGLAWHPVGDRPIITGANDAMSLIPVTPGTGPLPLGEATHFIYQQTWRHNPALPTTRDNLRGIHRRISIWKGESFAGRWVGPVTVLEPDVRDAPDLQFYWLAPYPLVGGGYGGFLNCHHTGDQTMDVQWVRSVDGWTWSRELNRRPLLPRGERGRFDCGLVMVAAQPVRWGDRAVVIYNGRATVHDGRPHFPNDPLPDPAQGIGVAEFSSEIL